ncbi:MAG: ferritin family protein [Halanaerobiales bacterium]|nr:ferritin family protein [Halanaerobiales bacterium]
MSNNKELEVIKEAILNENEGYQVYSIAAQKMDREEMKKSFKKLAAEELKHIEWLKDLYKSFEEEGELKFSVDEITLPAKPKIFKWEKIDEENLSFALSVFGIGVKMEKESIEYYKNAASSTNSEVAKKLYKKIINWEYQHLNFFQEQYDMIREDWWAEQNFQPF